MIGIPDRDYAAIRFEAFASEVLAPAILRPAGEPVVEVHQTAERLSPKEAGRAAYRPVAPGFRWGPVWSSAWFRIRGSVPVNPPAGEWALQFSSGTEAQLFRDGQPLQGFDDNRRLFRLGESFRPGAPFELLVEAACNMPLGVSTFWWDDPELVRRWQEERPGRYEGCSLVDLDRDVWDFHLQYEFARRLALALPEESARARELLQGLRQVTNLIPAGQVAAALKSARPILERLLEGAPHPSTQCVAVGHAHLDTAWLWTLAETRRKIVRSWSNALELMERFPGFRFAASQAQQYAFCKQDAPELFARIRARVAEGRFEAVGAMWVESDGHGPSGESLIRQIVHGVTFFRREFGADARQTVLFLPDTFGFPASLPQIMRLSGLETFVTDKMAWSERHEFPHVTFLWRGIDGTETLTHLTPGSNYNAPLQPQDLLKGEHRLLQKDRDPVAPQRAFLGRWLQPFGYGDGGGGPTEEIIRRSELAARVEGLPQVEAGRIDQFCASLHEARREAGADRELDLPVFDGELYLEQHRGTLTSQAWLKQANARAQTLLKSVEALLAAAPLGATVEQRASLDRLWKQVLLHQFHDILPGTSIQAVYDDARAAFATIEGDLERLLREAAVAAVGPAEEESFLVFNSTSHPRPAVVDLGSGPVYLAGLPALGGRVVRGQESEAPPPDQIVQVTDRSLQNGRLCVTLDDAGRVACLTRDGEQEPLNASDAAGSLLPLNQLVLYEDRPRRWDAWNLDFDYTEKGTLLEQPAISIKLLESGPLRGVIEVVQEFSRSTIHQRYLLTAGSPRLEIESRVVWNEERMLLRVLNPVNVRARHWTSGIQFGHLVRSAHRNTSVEQARFEVPGHRWMDLSQPGIGLAVLDDGKLGRSCDGNLLGLSLLRSATFPDETAERGEHRFRYALLPHEGDFRRAEVARQADELAEPPLVIPLAGGAGGAPPGKLAPFELTVEAGHDAEIACFKPAEDGVGLIMRLVERSGGVTACELRWNLPAATVRSVNLLEELNQREIEHDPVGRRTRFRLRPFEILTLRLLPEAAGPSSP